MKKNLKAIIFDYDGIIAESVNIKTEAFTEIYRPFGYEVVKKVVAHHLANGGVSRFEKFVFYHKKYVKKEINDEEVEKLSKQFSNLVINKVVRAPFVIGAYEFLLENYNKFDFFISTATPTYEILEILKRKNLLIYFKEVYGSPSKKNEHVKNIISKYHYNKDEVIFIGDSLSDREAAKINGINFIGRFTTDSKIKEEKYLIKDFYDLKNFLTI